MRDCNVSFRLTWMSRDVRTEDTLTLELRPVSHTSTLSNSLRVYNGWFINLVNCYEGWSALEQVKMFTSVFDPQ